MVKSAVGLGADKVLELRADTGESFLVKDVMIAGCDDDYVEVFIDRDSVGFFRVGKRLGSHLPFPVNTSVHSHDIELSGTARADAAIDYSVNIVDAEGQTQSTTIVAIGDPTATLKRATKYAAADQPRTILTCMREKGIFNGFPVAEGQKFVVTPYTSGKKLDTIAVVYERYDAGDIRKDMPQGTDATEYVCINYGDTGGALTAKGDYQLDSTNMPAVYPGFPFVDDVPDGTEIQIMGVLGSEVIDYKSATDYTYTTYLKLQHEREILFDEDKKGILFYHPVPVSAVVGTYVAEGVSLIGSLSTVDPREPFWLPTPRTFRAGETLTGWITVDQGTGTGSIDKDYGEIAFIQKVRKV